jgi:hypothetical protein
MLSVLWCMVSPGAVYLILHEASWRSAVSLIEAAKAVRLEQWVGFGLLAAHVWFLLQARLWMRSVRAAR